MGKSKRAATYPEDEVPSACPAVRVSGYGRNPLSTFNGAIGELGNYSKEYGYFEVFLIRSVADPSLSYKAGDILLCTADELEPLNDCARRFVDYWLTADVEVYPDDVYDIRDDLAVLGIMVKAESVYRWTGDQKARARRLISVLRDKKVVDPTFVPQLPENL